MLYSLAHFVHGAWGYQGYGDFFLILNSVRSWIATGQLWVDFGAYPPVHTLLMYPLAGLSDRHVALVMHTVNIICLVTIVIGLRRMAPEVKTRHWLLVVVPLVLNYRPLLYALSMIKIEVFELAVMVLAVLAYRRRRDGVSGALLAFAAMVKLLPAVLIAYFVWKREWRVVAGAVLTGITLVMVTVIAFGVSANVEYYRHLVGDRFSLSWVDNQSWTAAILRLFASFPPVAAFPTVPDGGAAHAVVTLGKGIFLVTLLVLTRGRLAARETLRLDCEIALWLVAMPVLSGFFRDYYAIYLLPAYVFLARFAAAVDGDFVAPVLTLGAVSYVLVGQGFPLGVLTRLPSPVSGVGNLDLFFHFSMPFLGYLALMAAVIVARTRLSEPTMMPLSFTGAAARTCPP